MKRYLFLLFITFGAFYSCEKNDCPYENKNLCDPAYVDSLNNVVDTTDTDTMTGDTGTVNQDGFVTYSSDVFENYTKKVLLEDFTGFRCVNCPDATATAENIKDLFGDQVVVVAVHSTSTFAAPIAAPPACFSTDFRTPASETYVPDFGINSLPNGTVNRKDFGQGIAFQPSQWSSNVNNVLEETPSGFVRFRDVEIDAETNELSFRVAVKLLEPLSESFNLTIGIYEDGIIEGQKDGTESICPYTHNHVFRGNINGTYGELALSEEDELDENQAKLFEYNYDLSTDWEFSNCHLFAYLHNSQTREIIQVEEVPFPL